jgi:hypothetical protein
MSVDYYLLPKKVVGLDTGNARAFLDRESKRWSDIPLKLDDEAETRKRRLADRLLQLMPGLNTAALRFDEIGRFEKITEDEARRKWRHIELNGKRLQFIIHDNYVQLSCYSGSNSDEVDAVLSVLSRDGSFVVYDSQVERVSDLTKGSLFDPIV